MPELGSTYQPKERSNEWRCSQHTSADQTPIPCVPVAQKEGVKSGYSGALKPGLLGLSCKANKCSNVGIGDLGALSIILIHRELEYGMSFSWFKGVSVVE